MKKHILAALLLALGATALPAQAKSLIGSQRAAAIAKSHVGGGKVDDIDLEHSRRHGDYYEVDVENHRGDFEVRIDARTGRVISVKHNDDDDDNRRHRRTRRHYKDSNGGQHGDHPGDDAEDT